MAIGGAPHNPPLYLKGSRRRLDFEGMRSNSDLRSRTPSSSLSLWFSARRFWIFPESRLLRLQPLRKSFIFAEGDFERACDDVIAIRFQVAAVQLELLD